MLVVAGALFGWSIALYSIIYQFCSTQIIQALYKRYQKETMFIISDKSNEIYRAIGNGPTMMQRYSRESGVMRKSKRP